MFRPDDKIGPYILLRTLGQGAFGEIWLAEKRSALLTTRAALKMPLVAENDVETVRQEAALWLQASGHPNIVPVLDADVYEGQVVIASEFIAGGSLHDWMQVNGGKAPTREEAVAVANGILAGLDYLHRVGLTHRDLKPENVLLQDGIPRLTDFGLARVLKTEAQTGNISGTPRYMAPETFSGVYSAASDLWAVGVMLQELLTGAHPFPTQDLMALIVAIQGHEPIPLPESISERLRDIVIRLLAKAPSDRFASASAVREALQNSLQPMLSMAVAPADTPALPPNNLPVQPTSFIGREKQIADLKGMLEQTHLLTLTGSGGSGKTRLSLKVAEEVLVQFPDGVWVVELAPVADATLVPQSAADVLAVREMPGQLITSTLIAALKAKCLLLVLDNCEHVLDAAADLVDAILRGCPSVSILASSRETLGIAGERSYRVPSLSLPPRAQSYSPNCLSQFEAIGLFTERAIAAKVDFDVTSQNASDLVQICRRLDGIPLAIELAAARVRSMTVNELALRLDDRFRILTGGSRTALPRQQTLRAMTDWSYDLLEAHQQFLLQRLSVFAGGWTLEAAEMVCVLASDSAPSVKAHGSEEFEAWEVLDLLTALADKSLVLAEEQELGRTRYRLLETIRQYARDRLLESGEGHAVRERHQAYFLAFAEEAELALQGPGQVEWLNRLEMEHENLRSALEWTNEEAALRIGIALAPFWQIRGYMNESREWFAQLLASTAGQKRTALRASALQLAGTLARDQSDTAAALLQLQEATELFEALGDKQGIASSSLRLGQLFEDRDDFPKSRELREKSLAFSREIGDKYGIAAALHSLGNLAKEEGDNVTAHAMYTESLAFAREFGDKRDIAHRLTWLGHILKEQGKAAAAQTVHEESLAIHRELGDKLGIAWSLLHYGDFAALQCEYSADGEYNAYLDESVALFREMEKKVDLRWALLLRGRVALEQGKIARARELYAEALTINHELTDTRAIAITLDGFVHLNALKYLWERAARLAGAAYIVRQTVSVPVKLREREDRERHLSQVRAALSAEAFAVAWADGCAMTMEQAIEYALEEREG